MTNYFLEFHAFFHTNICFFMYLIGNNCLKSAPCSGKHEKM